MKRSLRELPMIGNQWLWMNRGIFQNNHMKAFPQIRETGLGQP